MPRKVFTAGEVLAASDVNNFLMDQTVMVFAGTAARGSAIGTATEGMYAHLNDTDTLTYYNGSSWVSALPASTSAILQVVSANNNTGATTTSTSYQSTGLTATITPSSTSSKILIFAQTSGSSSSPATPATWTIFRGTVAGTDLAPNTEGMSFIYSVANGEIRGKASGSILDSPNTTSAVTYTFAFRSTGGGGTVGTQYNGSLGNMILMEVAG